MKYSNKKEIGICTVLGTAAAVAGSIWISYELGTLINDYFNITNTAARVTIDAIILGPVTAYVSPPGIYAGMRCDQILNELYQRKDG